MTRSSPSHRHRGALLVTGVVAGLLMWTTALAQSPAASAPAPGAASLAPAGSTVRLLTHGSFALSQPVLDSFAQQTGATIQVIPSADAGSAVNQAILTKSNPIADVLYGVDNTFLSRALDAGIFEPYQPAAIDRCPGRAPARPAGTRDAHRLRRRVHQRRTTPPSATPASSHQPPSRS